MNSYVVTIDFFKCNYFSLVSFIGGRADHNTSAMIPIHFIFHKNPEKSRYEVNVIAFMRVMLTDFLKNEQQFCLGRSQKESTCYALGNIPLRLSVKTDV